MSTSGGDLILRQTPDGRGQWDNVTFDCQGREETYDWWFVLHSTGLIEPRTVRCDPDHVVYCSMEPQDWVSNAFLEQFSAVISADPAHVKRGATPFNVATWWVGHSLNSSPDPQFDLNFEVLKEMPRPPKHRKISVISSGKTVLPGHQRRIKFLRWLKQSKYGRHIDFFGSGFNPVPDKWTAIEPYEYHIAIENSFLENYWSEKFSDAVLGYALPLYFGCPNLDSFFPQASYRRMDIFSYSEALRTIEKALDTPPSLDELQALGQARDAILLDFNAFGVMARMAQQPARSVKDVTLVPPTALPRGLPTRALTAWNRTTGRLATDWEAYWQRKATRER